MSQIQMAISFLLLIYTGATVLGATTTTDRSVNEVIEPYRPGHIKVCTDHNQCSCPGGFPWCYYGTCQCVYANKLCFSHDECAHRCGSNIGVCIANNCKCYNLVENEPMSKSLSPFINEDGST